MSNEWLKDLKKAYLFSTLSTDELSVIAAVAELHAYEPGETIFSQGDKPESLFIVRYGTVQTETWGPTNHTEDGFGLLGSGAVFGETSLLSHSPRGTSVEVIEKTEVIRIGFDKLTLAIDTKPAVALKVYKALAWHLGILFEKTTKEIRALRAKQHGSHHR